MVDNECRFENSEKYRDLNTSQSDNTFSNKKKPVNNVLFAKLFQKTRFNPNLDCYDIFGA